MYSQRGWISARKLETNADVAKLRVTKSVKGVFSLPAVDVDVDVDVDVAVAAAAAAVALAAAAVEAEEPLSVGKHMVDLVASEKTTKTVEQQRFADYNCNNRAIVGGRAEVLELATMQVQRFSVVCGLLVASCVAKWHKKEEGLCFARHAYVRTRT